MPMHNSPDIARGFIGRVHGAPTMRYENGVAVAVFTVVKETTASPASVLALGLSRVLCFGKRAEFVAAYLNAGQQVFVAGPDGTAGDAQTRGCPMAEIVASCVIPLGRLPQPVCSRSRRACADNRRAV